MHIAILPSETFKIGHILGELNEDNSKKQKFTTTSDELLTTFIKTFKAEYSFFCEKIALSLLKYEHNSELRE